MRRAMVKLLEEAGYTIEYGVSNGSGDSNIFSGKGFQCSGLTTGMFDVHTTNEYLDMAEFAKAYDLVWRLLTEKVVD